MMAKRIIQVPVDDDLLADLNRVSKGEGMTRAELIRLACQRYLRQLKQDALDARYVKGYEEVPEEPEMAEAQAELAAGMMKKEQW